MPEPGAVCRALEKTLSYFALPERETEARSSEGRHPGSHRQWQDRDLKRGCCSPDTPPTPLPAASV